MLINRKMAALVGVAAIVLTACSSSAASTKPSAAAGASGATAAGCKVGVSWNNYTEERWAKWDEPAIKAALKAAGAEYISNDAKSSAATQATNIDQLISQGAKVLIVLAQDGTAIKTSVASASSQGIPVIGYDRLIEDPKALYITFDNKGVGKMQATAIFKAVPKGNYVIIKGNKADANADFLKSGMDEVIGAAVASGDIKIVGETYTNDWKPALAQTEMEQFLTANSNKVALGNQTVDVWKDARELGKAAGEAAVQLCGGTTVDKITGAAPFVTPGKNTVSSIIIAPHPITKDNLNVVIDAGWITKDKLCLGVDAAKAPAACK